MNDHEFDELLGLVELPLEMREGREEQLLDALLGELEHGPIARRRHQSPEPGTPDAQRVNTDEFVVADLFVDPLDEDPDESFGIRTGLSRAIVGLAAAAIIVAGLVALVRASDGAQDIDVADDPAVTTSIVTTTTEAPPVLTIEEACSVFAAAAPDRLVVGEALRAGTAMPQDIDLIVVAFDELLVELERRDDLAESVLVDLRLSRGRYAQAAELLRADAPAEESFDGAADTLRVVQLEDARFRDCFRF
ncbi:MAG: hypothetical protein ACR2P0_13985 [Acidimicrobiales bacterium]